MLETCHRLVCPRLWAGLCTFFMCENGLLKIVCWPKEKKIQWLKYCRDSWAMSSVWCSRDRFLFLRSACFVIHSVEPCSLIGCISIQSIRDASKTCPSRLSGLIKKENIDPYCLKSPNHVVNSDSILHVFDYFSCADVTQEKHLSQVSTVTERGSSNIIQLNQFDGSLLFPNRGRATVCSHCTLLMIISHSINVLAISSPFV